MFRERIFTFARWRGEGTPWRRQDSTLAHTIVVAPAEDSEQGDQDRQGQDRVQLVGPRDKGTRPQAHGRVLGLVWIQFGGGPFGSGSTERWRGNGLSGYGKALAYGRSSRRLFPAGVDPK